MSSDRPGACSGRAAVLKFSELLQRQSSQLEKLLLIYLFIYLCVIVKYLPIRILSCLS